MRTVRSMMSQRPSDLPGLLIRTGALKFGTFTLASGILSPYYIDLRVIPSFPSAMKAIIQAYKDLIETKIGIGEFERIAGIPTAGVPYAVVTAYELDVPFLYIRKETKMH
jgi:orotate phosphoribosyltransferase